MIKEKTIRQVKEILESILASFGVPTRDKRVSYGYMVDKILYDIEKEAIKKKASDYNAYYKEQKQTEGSNTLSRFMLNEAEKKRETFNCIPDVLNNNCCRFLIVFCYEGDSLNKRMEEMIYHVGEKCADKTKQVLFVTTQWRFRVFNKHRCSIETLKKQGVQFEFVLLGHFGAVRLPLFH